MPDDEKLGEETGGSREVLAQIVAPGEDATRLESAIDENSKWNSTTDFIFGFFDCMTSTCIVQVEQETSGTGFLVGPDLVLTNYHVIRTVLASPQKAVRCRFDYWKETRRWPASAGQTVELAAANPVVHRSEYAEADEKGQDEGFGDKLDYALLRLARPLGEEPVASMSRSGVPWLRGWLTIPPEPRMPKKGEYVYVLQHPCRERGGRLEVLPSKLTQGKVLDIVGDDQRIRHDATTMKGSSGSALLDAELNLIGVHHAGDPQFKDLFPRHGLSDKGGENGEVKGNQAVPMALIARDIEKKTRDREDIVGVRPDIRPSVLQQEKPSATVARTESELVNKYANAAKILLDRQLPEEQLLDADAAVYPLLCRSEDRHLRFLERLEHLSLPCWPSEDVHQAQLDYLDPKKGNEKRTNNWVKVPLQWPKSAVHLEKAIDNLKRRLGRIGVQTNLLVEAAADLEDIDPERERDLMRAFADLCAERERVCSDRLKALIVYRHDDGWRSRRSAKRCTKIWNADRPVGVGECLVLDDIVRADLLSWRSCLHKAWDIDETKIESDVEAVFKNKRLSMAAVEEALDSKITSYVEKALDSKILSYARTHINAQGGAN